MDTQHFRVEFVKVGDAEYLPRTTMRQIFGMLIGLLLAYFLGFPAWMWLVALIVGWWIGLNQKGGFVYAHLYARLLVWLRGLTHQTTQLDGQW